MNNNVSYSKSRRWAWLWLAVCLLLAGTLATLLPKAKLASSVLALLPAQSMGQIPPALNDGFIRRLDRQLVWMVSPALDEDTRADTSAAEGWLERLRAQPTLSEVTEPMDADHQQQWGRYFYQHRNGLLDAGTRARLQEGGDAQVNWIMAQIYSAFSGVSGGELDKDPLLLVRGSQLALGQSASHLQFKDGWLVAEDEAGRSWYLLHGELKGDSYSMQQAHQVITDLDELAADFSREFPGAELLSRGTVFYSDYASQQAKRDISTLGTATVLGVLLLIFSVFRSLRPLLLSLLSIGMGALAGSTLTLLLFGELHLMTLVMSISVIGVSVDYTIYYLTERMVHGDEVTPWQSLEKVRPALLMALGTTMVAYLIMMLAPFPGLRQLAVFAVAGLSASCLTVVCWYPWLCRGLPVRPVPLMVPLLRWLAAWRRGRGLSFGLPIALALLSVLGLSRLEINDDIAQLQALPQGIHQQEQAITALTGQGVDQKWFVVYGDDAERTLQRLEAFAPALVQAKASAWLDDYRLLPLPSQRQQRQDLALLTEVAPKVTAQLAELGLADAAIDLSPMTVTADSWLNSVVSEGWSLLWLTLADGRSGVLIPTNGVNNSSALAELAGQYEGVSWVDRKADFDRLFLHYRTLLGWLLLAAVLVIAFSYMVRLGVRRGLVCVLPSLLSMSTALAVLALSGHSLNLFSLLALVLVLGIGINYTLFFSNPQGTPLTSLLAVSVALSTSLLTLGMLIFSSTQAISSFGIVLCSGIFTAYLLSPLAMSKRQRRKKS